MLDLLSSATALNSMAWRTMRAKEEVIHTKTAKRGTRIISDVDHMVLKM